MPPNVIATHGHSHLAAIDGNGRVARELASIQARDLFGLSEDLLIEKGAPYYLALRNADNGDPGALHTLLKDAIDGAA